MSIVIKLQGLPYEASSIDVRTYFSGLTIIDGGVHIVGGDDGAVFIEFASDEDARQAMARGDGIIKNSSIKLLLSSRTEMQAVVESARLKQQQYQQQQQQAGNIHQQQPITQSQNLNQPQSYLASGVSPMGPALLPSQQQTHQPSPFEGDPRLMTQNYQGVANVIGQHTPSNNRPQLPPQSIFVDPRILSQNYQSMLAPQQTQSLLSQQGQIFSQMPPVNVTTSDAYMNMGMLGNVGVAGGASGRGVQVGNNSSIGQMSDSQGRQGGRKGRGANRVSRAARSGGGGGHRHMR